MAVGNGVSRNRNERAIADGAGLLEQFFRARPSASLRLARRVFAASAFAYASLVFLDLAEHLRLEKEETGRYLRWKVVTPGETANHVMAVGITVAYLALLRPAGPRLRARDAFVLTAPVVLLALGWVDELIFHRRRVRPREALLHGLLHLAGSATLVSAGQVARSR